MKIAAWILQEYDWSVVKLMLKYEMAHQFVSEVLGIDNKVFLWRIL